MSYLSSSLKATVRQRAQGRREYCHLAQAGQVATFHIDHVYPVKLGGKTEVENLALACVGCSLHKAAKVEGIDPGTGQLAPLFHPRRDQWDDHFQWDHFRLVGKTPIGRATIEALQLNRAILLSIREEEVHWGRHP